MTQHPYPNPDDFFSDIERRYDALSKSLQNIARKLHLHRDHIALMSVQELAGALDCAPSALVRFAKTFGFSGYSEMKALFQHNLAQKIAMHDTYAERIRQVADTQLHLKENQAGSALMDEVFTNSISGLQALYSSKLLESLNAAATRMSHARALWVMAAGRSFPAAAYLTYLIQHSDKPIHWLNGLCFSLEEKFNALHADDALIVISYEPYAASSVRAVELAAARGASIIAVTDSHLSEIAKQASCLIEVRENSSFGFRGLVNTVAVVQTLFLLYASHTELPHPEH